MRKIFNNKYLYLVIAIASISPLAIAYVLEKLFSHPPCELCIYQRFVFFTTMVLALIAMFNRSRKAKFYSLIVIVITLLTGVGISFYHVGVENKIFESSCSSNLSSSKSIKDLLKTIESNPVVTCDQPTVNFLGVTLAAWNLIYQMLLLAYIVTVRFSIEKSEKRNSENVSTGGQTQRKRIRKHSKGRSGG